MTQNLTYNALVAQLSNYGERDDDAYVEQIPTFIMLAENRLATEMKQQGFQAVVTGQLPLTNSMPKPSFWRETISFGYTSGGVYQQLYLRSLEYCRQFWPSPSLTTAKPKYYADYNINNFYLAGTPADDFAFELVYYARLDPLSESHQENWLTLNAPQALLYACLLEASIWCKNDQDTARMKGEYGEAVGALIAENRERLADRGTVVERG